jgi:type I restriction enzyme S subunit
MDKENKNIPQIRFPGFEGEWEWYKLGDIANRFDNLRIPVTASLRVAGNTPYYGANGIQDYVEGFTHNGEFVLIAEDGANDLKNYPIKYVEGYIWVNNHAHVLQGKINICDNHFLAYSISQVNIEPLLVGGGRAKLNAEPMMGIELKLPSLEEQQKVGSYFKQIDNLITLSEQELNGYKELKKCMLQKMFPKDGESVPEIRFPGFVDEWEYRKLGEIIKVHSFKPYIAKPSNNGKYEVIQQGNDAVIGYADGKPFANYKSIVLFGDHTLSLYKPINPFFIATDGIKILDTIDNFDGYFFYSILEKYKPQSEGYKRHFSILKEQECFYTSNKIEQQKIGSYFKQLDNLITLATQELNEYKCLKKCMLQKMFC